jgi:hypothetical protein
VLLREAQRRLGLAAGLLGLLQRVDREAGRQHQEQHRREGHQRQPRPRAEQAGRLAEKGRRGEQRRGEQRGGQQPACQDPAGA